MFPASTGREEPNLPLLPRSGRARDTPSGCSNSFDWDRRSCGDSGGDRKGAGVGIRVVVVVVWEAPGSPTFRSWGESGRVVPVRFESRASHRDPVAHAAGRGCWVWLADRRVSRAGHPLVPRASVPTAARASAFAPPLARSASIESACRRDRRSVGQTRQQIPPVVAGGRRFPSPSRPGWWRWLPRR